MNDKRKMEKCREATDEKAKESEECAREMTNSNINSVCVGEVVNWHIYVLRGSARCMLMEMHRHTLTHTQAHWRIESRRYGMMETISGCIVHASTEYWMLNVIRMENFSFADSAVLRVWSLLFPSVIASDNFIFSLGSKWAVRYGDGMRLPYSGHLFICILF